MPSDDYSSITRGPLKLKGAKVTKHKKKSKKDKDKTGSDVDRALTTTTNAAADSEAVPVSREKRKKSEVVTEETEGRAATEERDEGQEDTKTEAERRFAEAKRKRVCLTLIPGHSFNLVRCADYFPAQGVDRIWPGAAGIAQDAQTTCRGAELAPLEAK